MTQSLKQSAGAALAFNGVRNKPEAIAYDEDISNDRLSILLDEDSGGEDGDISSRSLSLLLLFNLVTSKTFGDVCNVNPAVWFGIIFHDSTVIKMG